MLDKYPRTVISSKYYHEIITTGKMLGRVFGWNECPSVTEPLDNRDAKPKRLIHFIRWASDLKTMHRCCTSETRDCSTCKDGAAHMSWVMVNKRAHIRSTKDLQGWIEVYEMFAKLYHFIPWWRHSLFKGVWEGMKFTSQAPFIFIVLFSIVFELLRFDSNFLNIENVIHYTNSDEKSCRRRI